MYRKTPFPRDRDISYVLENYCVWWGARESRKSKGMQDAPLQLLANGHFARSWQFPGFRVSAELVRLPKESLSSFWRLFGIFRTGSLQNRIIGGFNPACGRQFHFWALPNAQEVHGVSYNREFNQEKILFIAAAIVVIFLVVTYWMYNPRVHTPPPVPTNNSETTQK